VVVRERERKRREKGEMERKRKRREKGGRRKERKRKRGFFFFSSLAPNPQGSKFRRMLI
jgi:hypothetical protein